MFLESGRCAICMKAKGADDEGTELVLVKIKGSHAGKMIDIHVCETDAQVYQKTLSFLDFYDVVSKYRKITKFRNCFDEGKRNMRLMILNGTRGV